MLPACCRFGLLTVVWMICWPLWAGNWPQWRGPDGDGTSREADLPVAWSEGAGVAWKCKLPEWGNSTPAIWGNAVFLTSHIDNRRLLLVKIDKSTGKIAWMREVGSGAVEPVPNDKLIKSADRRGRQQFHHSQNLASPSPVTDGRLVVVHFGNGELAAYDFDGRQLWRRNLQEDYGKYSIWWGHANSPVLYQDLVISVCIQDSCRDLLQGDRAKLSPSYVVAHDKQTGRERWRTMRLTPATAESCDSYTTPVFRHSGQQTELVVMGGQMLDAYDPASGRAALVPAGTGRQSHHHRAGGRGRDDLRHRRHAAVAVGCAAGRAGRRSRDDVVWKFEQGTPDSPTPVVWGQSLFLVTNDGIARCLDTHNGRLRWKERLKGEYRASPLAVEGRVYFLNTTGLLHGPVGSPRAGPPH